MSEPTVRPAARVLLLDERDRLLLFRIQVPGRDRVIWLTPGGGVEAGEDWETAAVRELWEETGLRGLKLSSCVWERRHVFTWREETIDAHERFFVARAEGTPAIHNAAPNDDETLDEHRWWSLEALQTAALEHPPTIFVPRALPDLLPMLLTGDYPIAPLQIGA